LKSLIKEKKDLNNVLIILGGIRWHQI